MSDWNLKEQRKKILHQLDILLTSFSNRKSRKQIVSFISELMEEKDKEFIRRREKLDNKLYAGEISFSEHVIEKDKLGGFKNE